MRRREFIALFGGAAALVPFAARAQRSNRTRKIGVLMGFSENDPVAQHRLAAFTQGLKALGWTEDQNLKIDRRWAAADVNQMPGLARELIALEPEVILSSTTTATAALHRETQTIPIVFVVVTDPIGSGFIENFAHPGTNITGFTNLEASLVQKWLELLKQIAPAVTRVTVMFNPQTAAAHSLGLRVLVLNGRTESSCVQEQPKGGVRPNARENGQIRSSTTMRAAQGCW